MKRKIGKKNEAESVEQQLSDLRATLAEDEAYRSRLEDGTFQARQVESKIDLWKRKIRELGG